VILGVGIWLLVGGKDKDAPVAESALPSSEAEGPATIKAVAEQVNDRPAPVVVMQKSVKVEQPNPKPEQTTASKPQVSSSDWELLPNQQEALLWRCRILTDSRH
jgi:hypothetical protein